MGERVDVVDLIINVLREHTRNLDALISKLERVLGGAEPHRAVVCPFCGDEVSIPRGLRPDGFAICGCGARIGPPRAGEAEA